MLYSVVVRLRPCRRASLEPTQGYRLYSSFLEVLSRSSPTLAQEMHDLNGLKPFTLSPLYGLPRGRGLPRPVTADTPLWFRATLLRPDLFAAFADGVLRSPEVTIGSLEAEVTLLITDPREHPWANAVQWADLCSTPPASRIRLRFHSPTTFRTAQARNLLFPQPDLVLRSLLRRWQLLAPSGVQPPAIDPEQALLTRYRLTTRSLRFDTHYETGFEGWAEMELHRQVDSGAALAQLGALAFYTGIGAKATMGMGQTRMEPHGSSIPDRAGQRAPQRG